MRKIIHALAFLAPIIVVIAYVVLSGTPVNAESSSDLDISSIEKDPYNNDFFPRELKYLFPPPVPEFSNPDRKFNVKLCEDGEDNNLDGQIDDPYETCNTTERVAYGAVDHSEELEQPVNYSHKLHAGQLQIECQYCHTYARRSKHAGIPPSQVCMNCHSAGKVPIDGRSETAQNDLKYLWEKFNKDEEIAWIKVHDVPDFVHFQHKRHVKAGVLCQECHGEVQDDHTVARRVGELTMGWCLNCHENHESIRSNYCTETDENGTLVSCEAEQLRRAEIKDCWTCHK